MKENEYNFPLKVPLNSLDGVYQDVKEDVNNAGKILMLTFFTAALTFNLTFAQPEKKKEEVLKPETFWSFIIENGENHRGFENEYYLKSQEASDTLEKAVEALYNDKDFNGNVTHEDSGELSRIRVEKPLLKRGRTYEILNVLDSNPQDSVMSLQESRQEVTYEDEEGAEKTYNQFLTLLKNSVSGDKNADISEIKDSIEVWEYIKENGRFIGSENGRNLRHQNLYIITAGGRSESSAESKTGREILFMGKLYEDGDDQIDEGDIGVLELKTTDYIEKTPLAEGLHKLIDNDPTDYSEVVYTQRISQSRRKLTRDETQMLLEAITEDMKIYE